MMVDGDGWTSSHLYTFLGIDPLFVFLDNICNDNPSFIYPSALLKLCLFVASFMSSSYIYVFLHMCLIYHLPVLMGSPICLCILFLPFFSFLFKILKLLFNLLIMPSPCSIMLNLSGKGIGKGWVA